MCKPGKRKMFAINLIMAFEKICTGTVTFYVEGQFALIDSRNPTKPGKNIHS
jgi:hypothetical protein